MYAKETKDIEAQTNRSDVGTLLLKERYKIIGRRITATGLLHKDIAVNKKQTTDS